jgi:hypothetical protein
LRSSLRELRRALREFSPYFAVRVARFAKQAPAAASFSATGHLFSPPA